MDYLKIYNCLIDKRRKYPILDNNIYIEKHHIIPKCCGGKDIKNNLIKLTAREHYIAHILLTKIYENTSYIFKILSAFNCMKYGTLNGNRKFKYNSKLYEILKQKYSELKKKNTLNNKNPIFGKIWIMNLDKKENILWDKNKQIPDGYYKGKCLNFEKLIEYKNIVGLDKALQYTKLKDNIDKELNRLSKLDIHKDIEYRNKERKINRIYRMYNWYLKYGYEGVVKQFNYKYSNANLHQSFRYYVKCYILNKTQGKKIY